MTFMIRGSHFPDLIRKTVSKPNSDLDHAFEHCSSKTPEPADVEHVLFKMLYIDDLRVQAICK
jgi:hypothetical protein